MFVLCLTIQADMSIAIVWQHPRLEGDMTADKTTFRAVFFEPTFLLIIILVPKEITLGTFEVDAIKISHFRFTTAYHETTPDGPPPVGEG